MGIRQVNIRHAVIHIYAKYLAVYSADDDYVLKYTNNFIRIEKMPNKIDNNKKLNSFDIEAIKFFQNLYPTIVNSILKEQDMEDKRDLILYLYIKIIEKTLDFEHKGENIYDYVKRKLNK